MHLVQAARYVATIPYKVIVPSTIPINLQYSPEGLGNRSNNNITEQLNNGLRRMKGLTNERIR